VTKYIYSHAKSRESAILEVGLNMVHYYEKSSVFSLASL